MQTRLSVLVAAAGLATAIQVDPTRPHVLFTIGAWFAAVAAILGALGLLPRQGNENGIESLEREFWHQSPDVAARTLLHRQLEILRKDEKLLKRRAWFVRLGYASLAVSIIFTAVQVSIP